MSDLLLALDVGNSNIVAGLYRGREQIHQFRLATERKQTPDEYGLRLKELLRERQVTLADLRGVCLCSVVPHLENTLVRLLEEVLRLDYLMIRTDMDLGIEIPHEETRAEVGTDLLAALYGARQRTQGPLVVCDLGTATTLSILDQENIFQGAIICPGLAICSDAILEKAPHLPGFTLDPPPRPYGTRTIESLQVGLVLGHAVMLDGLVERLEEEFGSLAVLATGGLAGTVSQLSRRLKQVEEDLLLYGIACIWERFNR